MGDQKNVFSLSITHREREREKCVLVVQYIVFYSGVPME